MKADIKLIRYIHPDDSESFTIEVGSEDGNSGFVAFVPDLSQQQVIGLLMGGIPAETVIVKKEN